MSDATPTPTPRRPNAARAADDPAVAVIASLVGDRWSILLVRALLRGLRRFDDLQHDLDISRAVLAVRLKKLVAAGIVERLPYHERPLRHEYRLTAMGLELSPMIVALIRWGARWLGDEGPHTVLVHRACDTELEQAFWCRTCRTTFGPSGVGARPA